MNPLEDSPKARKIAYQVFWVVSLVVGAAQVGFATAEAATPTWLRVTLGILPFVGAAIGYTAQANVITQEVVPRHAVNEKGYSPVEWLLVVLVVLIILIVLLKLLGLL